jgi:hypothetical protein
MRKILRLGRFDIPRQTIIENPEIAVAITNNMVIFRAEMMLYKDAIEYMAIYSMFDEIREGVTIPYYEIIVNKIGDEIKIKVKRKD